MITGLLFTIYSEELMIYSFLFFLLFFDVLWWSMYLGHTMPYSPSIHFHFGIPTTPTKNVAEVRRTVGPVLEAQRLQGDSDRTLRWLGRFMRESKPWTYTKFQWEIVQKYSKIKKISVLRQFWANGVETLLMASYGPREKTCKLQDVKRDLVLSVTATHNKIQQATMDHSSLHPVIS